VAKSRFEDSKLADQILNKLNFEPFLSTLCSQFEPEFPDQGRASQELAEQLSRAHEIDKTDLPDQVADALDEVKEQILVRDQHKPEYLIWDMRLVEDDEQFGFIEISRKNQLTKYRLDFSFNPVSNQFMDYFSTKISISGVDISIFSRKKV
jgi:hypothetical protein